MTVACTEGGDSLDEGAGVKLAGVTSYVIDVCICDVRTKCTNMVVAQVPELKQ